MRYAQIIMGPAGSGKSTYCSTIVKHGEDNRRKIQVVNLDPAAEHFNYEVMADIRELIHLDDAMEDEDLRFGPNGGLIFCLEYLIANSEWLEEQLGENEDDYILFDCPGQLELYTHMTVMKNLTKLLQEWNFNICAVFLLDSQFMVDPSKFFSGTLAALSTMVNLELPHVNILSKIDLLNKRARKKIVRYLEPDTHLLMEQGGEHSHWHKKYHQLSETIAKLVDDYSLVKFLPLDITNSESVSDVLLTIDNTIQYGEDLDVKVKEFEEPADI